MSIFTKLMEIQDKLNAPKGQYNSFGKYKYRSCEDILTAVKPLLREQALTLTLTDKIIPQGDRYYIEATAHLIDAEANPEDKINEITVTAYAREEETKKGMDASQVTGAASSYARKYALNGLFCIDDNKDSDATNTHGKNAAKPPIIDKVKLDALTAKLGELRGLSEDAYNKGAEWIENEYTAELEKLDVNQWKKIYDTVEARIERLRKQQTSKKLGKAEMLGNC